MKQELMIFGYDFPHFKTQEIVTRLYVEGYPIKYVLAAPWRPLKRATTPLRDAPSYSGMMETRALCERFDIPYVVAPHNSPEAEAYIRAHPVTYGIIGGAQILKSNIINLFPENGGIINTHEGMLPWVRGLDTLKWSIRKGLPMANSIHFITESIDEGRLIYQEKIEIREDDTPFDVSLRFMQMKPHAIVEALRLLESKKLEELIDLSLHEGGYGSIMTLEEAVATMKEFTTWRDANVGPAVPLNPLAEPFATLGKTQQ